MMQGTLDKEDLRTGTEIPAQSAAQAAQPAVDAETRRHRFFARYRNACKSPMVSLYTASNDLGEKLVPSAHEGIVCYNKINQVLYLNKFFEAINRSLLDDGIFIGCVETHHQLRKRLKAKYPAIIRLPFYFVHFMVTRVLPKRLVSKNFHLSVTRGKNRMIELSEVFGRLAACGFEVKSYEHIDGLTYFAVQKVKTLDNYMLPNSDERPDRESSQPLHAGRPRTSVKADEPQLIPELTASL